MGSAGSAAFWCPPDGVVRPLPGLEALVYADPVGTQVRTWACPRACPLLCTFPVPSDPVLPACLPLCL